MNTIAIACAWAQGLAADDRYRGSWPELQAQAKSWQEDLAREIDSSMAHLDTPLGPQVVVDIEMFFPEDEQKHDPKDYLQAILSAVEIGTRIDAGNLIPFIRSSQTVGEAETGFLIKLYSAHFGGHNLTGTIGHVDNGATLIILDKRLPKEWNGTRIQINLGVIRQ